MRPASSELIASLSPGASAKHFSTVYIKQKDGTEYWFINQKAETIGGQLYEAKLEKVGQLKETLEKATNRVSVIVSNLDGVFGLKTASELRPLRMAQVTIRRYTPHIPEHNHYFFGFLSNPQATEKEVTFEVVPRSEAAGLCLANHTISARNGFINPDLDEQSAPSGGDGGGVGGGINPGGFCFVKGTPVYADFETLKPNDEFEQGSLILSFNPNTLELEMDTVKDVIRQTVNEYLEITFSDKTVLQVTKEHPFFTSDKVFAPISYLQLKTGVYKFSNGKAELIKLTGVKLISKQTEVVNFEVEKNKTYLPCGFAVHNSKPEEPVPGGNPGEIQF